MTKLRYYGGKQKLLKFIMSVVEEIAPSGSTFGDPFAGTGVVGLAARNSGFEVHANDVLYFSYCLNIQNLCFLGEPKFTALGGLGTVLEQLNRLSGIHGFVSEHYGPAGAAGRQYFSAENASKVDAIRTQIHTWSEKKLLAPLEQEFLIAILLRSINLVSNVTGTYGAFLKSWDKRALNSLRLTWQESLIAGPIGTVSNVDVLESLKLNRPDVVYLDPPYNGRDYASNYFLLEIIALGWFEVDFSPKGVTGIVPLEGKKSLFSSKRTVQEAFEQLFANLTSPFAVLSYSDEGLLSISELVEIMSKYGDVEDLHREHKRFRSINQDGSNPFTKEHLLVLKR